MPKYVVRKPALTAEGAIRAVKENQPNATNVTAKVDPKRHCRRGRVYKVSFQLKKRKK